MILIQVGKKKKKLRLLLCYLVKIFLCVKFFLKNCYLIISFINSLTELRNSNAC